MFNNEKGFQKQIQTICDIFDIKGANVLLVRQRLDILRENLGRFPDDDEIDRELQGLGIQKAVLSLDRTIRGEFGEKETLVRLQTEDGNFERAKANQREANAIKRRYYLGPRVEGD